MMSPARAISAESSRCLRIGSVSFLNAKPLIYGLESDDSLELNLDVPAKLLDGLMADRFDVALLPVIDYQRMADLRVLTAGGIGCDGPTLTVRIFSPTPIERMLALACDCDSHTSVALARIILAAQYGIRPELVTLDRARHIVRPDTGILLIGDKVVCEEPRELPYQLDLGEAWKNLTGLPFVFAAWMARGGVDLGDLPQRLERAKREGLAHVDQIIRHYATPRGWPPEIARRYLTHHLKFDIGPAQLHAIRHFHKLAHEHGVLESAPRELVTG
jgi:chorismate dehydratase